MEDQSHSFGTVHGRGYKAVPLWSETGGEESGCQFALWKEAEIKQIYVYPMPSISFILSQLKIHLEGAFEAGDVCGTQNKSLCGLLACKAWDEVSQSNKAFNTHSVSPAVFHLGTQIMFLIVRRPQILITLSLQIGKHSRRSESAQAVAANLQQDGEGSQVPSAFRLPG